MQALAQVALSGGVPPADKGDISWMLTSTALVLLMSVPALALFYGGLVRTKNVLGTMMHSFVPLAIIGVLWTMVGYSLTFGTNGFGGIIGWNSDFFRNSTPGLPPVPFLAPIVRSTTFT